MVKNGLTRLRIWFIIFVKSKELLEAGQCLPVPLYFIVCSLPVHKNDKKTADVINPNYFEEQYIIIEQVELHWIFLSTLYDYNTALQRFFQPSQHWIFFCVNHRDLTRWFACFKDWLTDGMIDCVLDFTHMFFAGLKLFIGNLDYILSHNTPVHTSVIHFCAGISKYYLSTDLFNTWVENFVEIRTLVL